MIKEAGFSEISITYEKGPGMPKMKNIELNDTLTVDHAYFIVM